MLQLSLLAHLAFPNLPISIATIVHTCVRTWELMWPHTMLPKNKIQTWCLMKLYLKTPPFKVFFDVPKSNWVAHPVPGMLGETLIIVVHSGN